jgi:hypothetical protein
MTRRTGVTLVEVLVAIFVMAIGLIALLTLFPIGVLRMYQALRDERCAQCAYSADKLAMMNNIRNDAVTVTAPNDPYNLNKTISDVFLNPGPFDAIGNPLLPNADPFGESYPILVDPIGYKSSLAKGRDWVGSTPGVLRRRRTQPTSDPITGDFVTRNTFTLLDDIIFESTATNPVSGPGTPQKVAGAILRDTRYSWAYLLRRPLTSDRSVVDCSIVVFDQRPLALVAGLLSLEEYVYVKKAYFDANKGTITVDYTNDVPPPLRVGDWILDSTFVPRGVGPAKTGSAHAYFYRVVATEELVNGGKTCARYEVQNPIRGFVNTPLVPDPIDGTPAYLGTVIVIRGIAEVFEKGPARLP